VIATASLIVAGCAVEVVSDPAPAISPTAAAKQPEQALPTKTAIDNTALVLTAVRVGLHDGYDRLVFDISGDEINEWSAIFGRHHGLILDYGLVSPGRVGSGEDGVRHDSDHILLLQLGGFANPALSAGQAWDGTVIHGRQADPSYLPDGRLLRVGGSRLNEVIYRGWYDGYLTLSIGLHGTGRYEVPLNDEDGWSLCQCGSSCTELFWANSVNQPEVTITLLENPMRLVADIAH